MPLPTLFPALRCRMGDWIYYVTFMSFSDINEWIRPTNEIHKSKKLSDWIQRELQSNHAKAISTYLETHPERMFNALFVGIYGGKPQWGELQVNLPQGIVPFEVTESQLDNLSRSVGILHFSGEEKLFAIDGQHRVAGIKKAIENDEELNDEEVTVILVGHQTDLNGRQRTRRLFTTLNKTARRVSQTDIIALDEDNGAAIVTRRLIDEFSLFQEGMRISFASTANLIDTDANSITSIITLYDIVKSLASTMPGYSKKNFIDNRPDESQLDSAYDICCNYWDLLTRKIPEYKEVFRSKKMASADFRSSQKNHLLFRPVGQRAFVESVAYLVKNYEFDLDKSIDELSKVDLWLNSENWHYILWNPIEKGMLPKAKNKNIAKFYLLTLIGRDDYLTRKQKEDYAEFMSLRESEMNS